MKQWRNPRHTVDMGNDSSVSPVVQSRWVNCISRCWDDFRSRWVLSAMKKLHHIISHYSIQVVQTEEFWWKMYLKCSHHFAADVTRNNRNVAKIKVNLMQWNISQPVDALKSNIKIYCMKNDQYPKSPGMVNCFTKQLCWCALDGKKCVGKI